MKQIEFSEYGTAEVLHLVERSQPQVGPGELLLKVQAAGVNFSDVLRRRNTYFLPTPLPFVPGTEAVGLVVASGEGVDAKVFPKGSMVLGILPAGGAYAEYVVVAAQYAVPLPVSIKPADATAIFVQGTTAYLLLHEVAGNLAGKTIMVQAAAGGVGSLLVQLGKLAGARVIACCSSAEKLTQAQKHGADLLIDYTRENWTIELLAANENLGVDYIFEMIGGEIFTQSFSVLKPGGTVIVYGAASGQQGIIESEKLVDHSFRIQSFNLAHYIQEQPELWQKALGKMIEMLATQQINIEVANIYPLSEARAAHHDLEQRRTRGKVVLVP